MENKRCFIGDISLLDYKKNHYGSYKGFIKYSNEDASYVVKVHFFSNSRGVKVNIFKYNEEQFCYFLVDYFAIYDNSFNKKYLEYTSEYGHVNNYYDSIFLKSFDYIESYKNHASKIFLEWIKRIINEKSEKFTCIDDSSTYNEGTEDNEIDDNPPIQPQQQKVTYDCWVVFRSGVEVNIQTTSIPGSKEGGPPFEYTEDSAQLVMFDVKDIEHVLVQKVE